jgi:hypothetical protein
MILVYSCLCSWFIALPFLFLFIYVFPLGASGKHGSEEREGRQASSPGHQAKHGSGEGW